MADIEELRARIEDRLAETSEEASRLRAALDALSDVARVPRDTPPRAKTSTPRPSARRAARGSVQRAVLAALADGRAKTPAQIAAATGLRRTTIASTLPRLVSTGTLMKAQRGYRLPTEREEAAEPADGLDPGLRALRSELGAGLRTARR